MLSNEQIASLLGVPQSRVADLWPLIDAELADKCKASYSDAVRIAALATIRVECPPFKPIREWAGKEGDERFVRLYWDNERVRKMLGNRTPADAVKYCGHGLIQLTGYDNHRRFGVALGLDLVSRPELGLQPEYAAKIFAYYFRVCADAANAHDWTRVREKVNGGHNGLLDFLFYVKQLAQAAGYAEMAMAAEQQAQEAKAEQQKKAAAAKA